MINKKTHLNPTLDIWLEGKVFDQIMSFKCIIYIYFDCDSHEFQFSNFIIYVHYNSKYTNMLKYMNKRNTMLYYIPPDLDPLFIAVPFIQTMWFFFNISIIELLLFYNLIILVCIFLVLYIDISFNLHSLYILSVKEYSDDELKIGFAK